MDKIQLDLYNNNLEKPNPYFKLTKNNRVSNYKSKIAYIEEIKELLKFIHCFSQK